MNSHNFGFATETFNTFHPFTTEDLEALVPGILPTNRLRKSVWEWLTSNGQYKTLYHSPPALGDLLSAPASSCNHCKPTPADSVAFYSFLNGEVYLRLLEPQPKLFLRPKRKNPNFSNGSHGPYYLSPCNGFGCVIYPSK
ncbi:hypothetical protein O181_057178 [Austropuccinia psidii MF-1]|uniref:Uncharacterized protein n=1 Tax=Austropuccinia psidii MF-1 TaxID=1389203 RepID=A0A9Q3HU81_9BASI|nr:hypothetical protein [Austropuccinia psidii MF-1]